VFVPIQQGYLPAAILDGQAGAEVSHLSMLDDGNRELAATGM
jgi:hypothetical protein